MVCGWMAWSGLLVLVVTCVSKFSLPGGGLYYYYYFNIFFSIVAGFGIYRKYEDSSSGLTDILLKFHLKKNKEAKTKTN